VNREQILQNASYDFAISMLNKGVWDLTEAVVYLRKEYEKAFQIQNLYTN
jgi:hypothetical protein